MMNTSLSRRVALGRVLGTCTACLAPAAWGLEATLPYAGSLADELALALRAGSPLVVMVSLEGCAVCKVARTHYLAPLRAEQSLVMVQLDMRSERRVRDFMGAELTHEQLIGRWGVKVAPTVLFFGRGGAEVAERMQGGYNPDYYGAILEDRLRAARVALTTAKDKPG
jgi:hypothetical protein